MTSINSKRILVTGGAGFIGSHLVRLLLRTGHDVLNIDKLTYAGNLLSLADVEKDPGYQFLRGDICDRELMRRVVDGFRPEAIMNLAAESHVDRSISGPAPFAETNVMGTFNLLEAATEYWRELPDSERAGFRFVQVSTDEVYGSLGSSGVFHESSPYAPRSPYSASKAAADHFVRAWRETWGLPTIVTCSCNNYGPCQHPEKLVPTVVLRCLGREPIPIYGSGENVRDWLFVEDHCEALLGVVKRGNPGRTYHIAGGNEMPNIELVRMLCGIMDRIRPLNSAAKRDTTSGSESYSQLIEFVADRPGHDFRYSLDPAMVRKELGWVPRQDQQACFQQTVQWYLDNPDWWKAVIERNTVPASPSKPDSSGQPVTSARLK